MRAKQITFILFAILLAGADVVVGQQNVMQFSVAVTPEKAALQPGDGLQFQAQLFDAQGKPVTYSDFRWSVVPDSMGTINERGYFVAGKNRGEVKILASMTRMNARYSGDAVVQIGIPELPEVRIIVSPQDALVAPLGTQQYHVTALARDNANFTIDHVRWAVEPNTIGKIDNGGLFQAADIQGQGAVLAYVDIANVVYTGVARVTVSSAPTGSIAGQVSDAVSGLPLAGAHLLVQKLGAPHWVQTATADSLGNYVAGKLIPGLYIVLAQYRDYLPEYYDNVSNLSQATPVQVQESANITGIDFALGHGGTISGMVAADVDSTPLAGALVSATLLTNRNVQRFAVTRDDGSFSLRALPLGSFAIHASANGYKGEYYDDATDLLTATLLQVTPPDSITGIDMYLATSSAVSGRVVASGDGTPIAGALIQIFPKFERRPVGRFKAISDKHGNYLASVPAGSYIVFAGAAGYEGEYYDEVNELSLATEVVVVEGEHTTGVDFSLDKMGSISGTVTDESTGLPIADAWVHAFREKSNDVVVDSFYGRDYSPNAARTDSLGQYHIKNLGSGNYFVLATAKGYLSEYYQEAALLSDATPVAVTTNAEVSGIDFTLTKGGTIAGTVFDSLGTAPLAGAAITLWSDSTGVRRHVYSDQGGNYLITGLPAGDYILFASLKGYDGKFYDGVDNRADATPVHVETNANVNSIDFYLPRFSTRFGTITGVVASEFDSTSSTGGAPIVGALVLAIPVAPGAAHIDVTDPFGNYQITNLVPGDYIVLAWAPGYLGEFYDNVRDWGQATHVQAVSNQITSDVNFALTQAPFGPYRVRGHVRRGQGANKQGVNGAVVYAFNENGIIASVVTGLNGEFSLDGVPAGSYKLKVTGSGVSTSFYGGASEATAQTVTLADGKTIDEVEIEAQDSATGIPDNGSGLPTEFRLEQNYPNPFNPTTNIQFALATQGHVSLEIYNVLGQLVRTLVDKDMQAGYHTVQWDGTTNAGQRAGSGLYFMRFEAGKVVTLKRMVMLK